MSKKLIAVVVALIVVVIIVAFFAMQYQQQEAERERIRKTLVVGTTDKVERGIDPAWAVSPTEMLVMKHIHEGMYITDPATMEVKLNLATALPTVSADGLNWDIPLRQNVKFHDGTPFNASCVKFSFERCISQKGPTWDIWYGMIDRVEVLDTYKVRIKLKDPYGPYLRVLASGWNGIVSPTAVNKMGEEAFQRAPVGSGPFKFSSWTRGEEVVLAANKDYWGEKPKVDKLVIKLIKDSPTLKLAMEKGEIDIALREMLPVDVESLRKNPDVVVKESPGTFQQYLSFNLRRVPKEARQAIAYAINYDDIMSRVYLGTAIRALSVFPPKILGYKPALERYKYDPDKAKQLLSKLGYTPEHPLKLELMITPTHYGDLNDDVAVVMKDSLKNVGIDAEIKTAEWATFIDLWVKGSYDMLMGGWWMDWPDPDNWVWGMLKSDTYIGAWSGYNNSRMDELILKGREVMVEAERIRIYEEIQDIYAEDLPFLCYVNTEELAYTRKNVKGFVLPITPYPMDFATVYKE